MFKELSTVQCVLANQEFCITKLEQFSSGFPDAENLVFCVAKVLMLFPAQVNGEKFVFAELALGHYFNKTFPEDEKDKFLGCLYV